MYAQQYGYDNNHQFQDNTQGTSSGNVMKDLVAYSVAAGVVGWLRVMDKTGLPQNEPWGSIKSGLTYAVIDESVQFAYGQPMFIQSAYMQQSAAPVWGFVNDTAWYSALAAGVYYSGVAEKMREITGDVIDNRDIQDAIIDGTLVVAGNMARMYINKSQNPNMQMFWYVTNPVPMILHQPVSQ